MPTNEPLKNLKEHPHTYVIQNQSSDDELTRLDLQDRLFTEGMGGLVSEQPDPTRFQSVLDVACGPGWWLIELAKTYPTITRLAGVDISGKVIEHARAMAEEAGVSDRVTFQTGDALRMLDFPDKSFDLVNLRLGMGWVKKWDWPKLIREFQRVARRGGVIRITESGGGVSNSPAPAMNRLNSLFEQALYNAGHFFSPGPGGMIDHLVEQMEKYGIMNVQSKRHELLFRAGSAFIEDVHKSFKLLHPFLKKWVKFSDDYDALYKQMVEETQRPDFAVTVTLLTAWGEAFKPTEVGTKRSYY